MDRQLAEEGKNRGDFPEGPPPSPHVELHPVFWIMAAAVLAPLLAELPLRVKVPVVVFEVLLGILMGWHGLGLVHPSASSNRCSPSAWRPRCSWPAMS